MADNILTIMCDSLTFVVTVENAIVTELATNILYRNSNDKTWKEIGNRAYNLPKSNGTSSNLVVPIHIFNEFPLKHWEEYKK